jgi:Flp pilus assembly protein TadB
VSPLLGLRALLALVAGVAVGGGLVLLVAAVRGLPVRPAAPRNDRAGGLLRFGSQRGLLALGAGFAVLLATRWPVAASAAAVLVLLWDRLFGGAASERAAMQRVEALAAWTESLRDTIAGAVGLEQAIPASVRAAAPVLQPHVRALVDRLRARVPLPEALQQLADDLDDPSADLVIAALILNARLRGPGLREILGALARSSREEVGMRQRVEAQRASTRRSVQIVVGVSVFAILALAIFNHNFVEPYDTPLGQLVLLAVLGLFAAGFAWLRRLAAFEGPSRFLVRAPALLPPTSASAAGGGGRGSGSSAHREGAVADVNGAGRGPGGGR